MAMTATLTLDRSTSTVNQKVRGVVVVSNSDPTNAVTVQTITPRVRNSAFPLPPTVSAAIGQCLANTPVPPSSSATFVFDVMIHTLNPMSTYDVNPTSNVYNIGCSIMSDDGSLISPTSQSVTIIPEKNYGSF